MDPDGALVVEALWEALDLLAQLARLLLQMLAS